MIEFEEEQLVSIKEHDLDVRDRQTVNSGTARGIREKSAWQNL